MNETKVKPHQVAVNTCMGIGCTFLIVLLFLYALSQTNTSTLTKVNWKPYSPTKELGHLYKLYDIETKKTLYITTEEKVSEDMLINKNHRLTFLETNDIWNPRACAKMPSVTTSDGTIYMIDSTLREGVIEKNIIRYRAKERDVMSASLPTNIAVLGALYIGTSTIYFLSNEEHIVIYNTIDTTNDININKKQILTLDKQDFPTLYERNSILYIKNTHVNHRSTLYRFTEQHTLLKVDILPIQERVGNLKQTKMLGNGVLVYSDFGDIFSVGIVYGKNAFIPLFKPEHGVISYIVGGY